MSSARPRRSVQLGNRSIALLRAAGRRRARGAASAAELERAALRAGRLARREAMAANPGGPMSKREALEQAIARRERWRAVDVHRAWQRAQAQGFRGTVGSLKQAAARRRRVGNPKDPKSRSADTRRRLAVPATAARRAAAERAQRLEAAAWLASGVQPVRLSKRADALYRAVGRRVRTTNPRKRKARSMAKAKRNRFGRFVKTARRHVRRARNRLGHFISASKPKRRKARTTRKRTSPRRRKNPGVRFIAIAPTEGGTMPRALVANPKRRRAKRRRGARSASGRFLPTTKRRRRRARRVSNPRRHRRHARRNPGMPSGLVRSAMASLLPMGLGGIGGAISGFADAKLMADKPILSAASKVALGAVGAALLRKRPALAFGFAGGVMGSFGYSMGVKAAGGLVATSPTAALKGIADMANDDPEMAALLEGLGELAPDNGVGDVEGGDDYVNALADADDDLSDLVEAS